MIDKSGPVCPFGRSSTGEASARLVGWRSRWREKPTARYQGTRRPPRAQRLNRLLDGDDLGRRSSRSFAYQIPAGW